jgi:putative endonuclease
MKHEKYKNLKISHNTFFGKKGEDIIVEYLKKQGYRLLARNYKRNHGEIDIIAQKNAVVAFVEVKLRQGNMVPLECLVSDKKQRKIEKTARLFIAENNIVSHIVFRFDVALVSCHKNSIEYQYIESAFFSHE